MTDERIPFPDERAPGGAGGPASLEPAPPPDARLPDDLRVPWSWPELLAFLVIAAGSIVFWSAVAGTGLGLLGMIPGDDPQELLGQNPALYTGVLTLAQALAYATMLAYLFLTIRVLHGAPYWRSLGWRAPRTGMGAGATYALCALGGMAFAFTVQMASHFIERRAPLPIEELFRTRESILIMTAMGLLVAPLVEETLFRGYLYPVLARGLGATAGVVFTGALFGLAHSAQLWGGWEQIALLVVVGIVFTAVRAATGSVTASYFLHLGYNGFFFATLYVATEGFHRLPVPPG